MLRKAVIFCMLICATWQCHAQVGRSEIALGYGYYTIYSIANGAPFNSSTGAIAATYRYYITKDFTAGLTAAWEHVHNIGTFTTIAPELSICYLDTREDNDVRIRLYAALSYGIAIYNNNGQPAEQNSQNGVWAYGLQATPIGLRIGRQLAFFAEMGVGYKGLIHSGADFRFPRVSAHNRYHDDN